MRGPDGLWKVDLSQNKTKNKSQEMRQGIPEWLRGEQIPSSRRKGSCPQKNYEGVILGEEMSIYLAHNLTDTIQSTVFLWEYKNVYSNQAVTSGARRFMRASVSHCIVLALVQHWHISPSEQQN